MELYAPIKGRRTWKILVAAGYTGNDVKEIGVDMMSGEHKTKKFLAMNPLGKVPVLKTAEGTVFESNAIARYVASVGTGDRSIYPRAPFDKATAVKASQIDAWIDFNASALDPAVSSLLGFTYGRPYDKGLEMGAKMHLEAQMAVLDKQLASSTFLVGDSVTLADIACVCDLAWVFRSIFDEKARNKFPSVTRWFVTCSSMPHFVRVIGSEPLCKTPINLTPKGAKPTGGGKGKAEPKAEKPKADKPKAAEKPKADKPKADAKPKGDKPAAAAKPGKGPKPAKPGKEVVPKTGGKEVKKETQLGISVGKEADFGAWYSEVVTASELIEYYEISGCYILRPWAYSIWQTIQYFLDEKIKGEGVENCYFPLFVSERALIAEKDHVEGFAPEVAWVTRSGKSELECPIAVRPTSETVMYPIFSNWIRSHRDLPLKLNQWCNVVRWEFKNPTPFIRSREFLWQEGHTAFATKPEADKEVRAILDIYRSVYEDVLAVPVIQGVKSEKEKFAGGLYTTTVEAFVPMTGRGIQGATSHCLGQNFAKMFNISFETEDKDRGLVWQNSWGLTTRVIGVMIMVHGDDKGLVLPPNCAPTQVVVVPIPFKDKDRDALVGAADELGNRLKAAGCRIKVDSRDNYTPGWKYNHWELKGVPLRCELGPRDLQNQQVVIVRRDTGVKETVAWADIETRIPAILATMHKEMLVRATKERDGRITTITKWEEFTPALNNKHMVLAPWCEDKESEEWAKNKSSEESAEGGAAKTLCIPFDQPPMPKGTKCFITGKPATRWTLFGRSY